MSNKNHLTSGGNKLRKVVIKSIDVMSIVRPLFFGMLFLSLAGGLVLSLIMLLPIPIETVSVNGEVVTNIIRGFPEVFTSILSVFLAISTYMISIYISIILVVIVFNLFCRYTGGIGIEIESLEEQ